MMEEAATAVRVVARIRPGGDSSGSFRVTACVSDAAGSSSSSGSAFVSFIPINKEATPVAGALTPLKDCEYMLDYCYGNDDSSTLIFNNEVKHLLDGIFSADRHKNACVVSCGATAKTHLTTMGKVLP